LAVRLSAGDIAPNLAAHAVFAAEYQSIEGKSIGSVNPLVIKMLEAKSPDLILV
jgi:hypothetical protein